MVVVDVLFGVGPDHLEQPGGDGTLPGPGLVLRRLSLHHSCSRPNETGPEPGGTSEGGPGEGREVVFVQTGVCSACRAPDRGGDLHGLLLLPDRGPFKTLVAKLLGRVEFLPRISNDPD